MLNRIMVRTAALAALFVAPFTLADQSAVISEAKPIMMNFGQNLKAELKQAMMSGGPLKGLDVCHLQAPKIAEEASQSGWQVARTSLKWRNENNQPDQWEQEQLVEFERQLKAGVAPKKLWAVHEGEKETRVMKAIMTNEICLACHGETLMPSVSKKLSELYPNDRATGFKAGDIRGAFSLTKSK